MLFFFKMCLSRKCISLQSAVKDCAEWLNLFVEYVGGLFLELGACNFYWIVYHFPALVLLFSSAVL